MIPTIEAVKHAQKNQLLEEAAAIVFPFILILVW